MYKLKSVYKIEMSKERTIIGLVVSVVRFLLIQIISTLS